MNKGVVYALWEYESQSPDELSFAEGDAITILRRQDDNETGWWWGRLDDKEGYIPRNLLGVRRVFPQIKYLHWLSFCAQAGHTECMAPFALYVR